MWHHKHSHDPLSNSCLRLTIHVLSTKDPSRCIRITRVFFAFCTPFSHLWWVLPCSVTSCSVVYWFGQRMYSPISTANLLYEVILSSHMCYPQTWPSITNFPLGCMLTCNVKFVISRLRFTVTNADLKLSIVLCIPEIPRCDDWSIISCQKVIKWLFRVHIIVITPRAHARRGLNIPPLGRKHRKSIILYIEHLRLYPQYPIQIEGSFPVYPS